MRREIILMGFSTDTEKFLLYSKEAHYKFQKHQTPFAAVKLYFSGLGAERDKVDYIVGNNFRTDKDFILKSENNFAILMDNTYLQTAEAVINRISKKLSRLRFYCQIKPAQHLKAHACIYAACDKNAKLRFKHFDLIKSLVKKREKNDSPLNLGEYLKWTNTIIGKNHKAFSIKI